MNKKEIFLAFMLTSVFSVNAYTLTDAAELIVVGGVGYLLGDTLKSYSFEKSRSSCVETATEEANTNVGTTEAVKETSHVPTEIKDVPVTTNVNTETTALSPKASLDNKIAVNVSPKAPTKLSMPENTDTYAFALENPLATTVHTGAFIAAAYVVYCQTGTIKTAASQLLWTTKNPKKAFKKTIDWINNNRRKSVSALAIGAAASYYKGDIALCIPSAIVNNPFTTTAYTSALVQTTYDCTNRKETVRSRLL